MASPGERRKKKKGDEAPSPPCTHPFGALPILSQHCMQALGTYILWKMHPHPNSHYGSQKCWSCMMPNSTSQCSSSDVNINKVILVNLLSFPLLLSLPTSLTSAKGSEPPRTREVPKLTTSSVCPLPSMHGFQKPGTNPLLICYASWGTVIPSG